MRSSKLNKKPSVTKKRRDMWQSCDWVTYFHQITTSVDDCIAKAAYEDNWDLVTVIQNKAEIFEPLQDSEKTWEGEVRPKLISQDYLPLRTRKD